MRLLFLILSIGLIATLAMTAFSYAMSYFTNCKLKEPQLLNILINRTSATHLSLDKEHVVGWALHILVGMLFVGTFVILHALFNFSISLLTGVVFGFSAGLVGVCFWSITFYLHPNPPAINRTIYYIQLIPAHILFGITMIALF